LVLEDGIARLQRGNHRFEITFPRGIKATSEEASLYDTGPFRVVNLKLEASGSLIYHLAFN
jgi:hypothetical protein